MFLGLSLLSASTTTAVGQTVTYAYDACGNRTSRTIVMGNGTSSQSKSRREAPAATYIESTLSRSVLIHQDPAGGQLQVEVVGLDVSDDCRLSLYSTTGARVLDVRATTPTTTLDLSTSPGGCYLLLIQMNGERRTWKIIKK